LLRLVFLAAFGGLDEDIHDSMSDQYIYLDVGRNLAKGEGFSVSADTWIADAGKQTSIVPPLYPLFVALCFRAFGKSLIPIRLLQVFLSLVVVIVACLVGCGLFNQRTGVIAGLVTATYPALVMYVRPIMAEGLFFPLLALLVWITYKLDREVPPRWLYPAWGLVGGLAILTRTEVVLLVGLIFFYLAYRKLQKAGVFKLRAFLMLLSALLFILLPYALYNYSVHHKLSPIPNAKWKLWDHTWWTEMRDHPEWQGVSLPERQIVPDWEKRTESERDAYLGRMAIQFICENPRIYIAQRAKRLFWSYPLLPLEEIPMSLGNKGSVARPDGYQYGPTSLDDVVKYVTPIEEVRVWLFRVTLVLAVGGLILVAFRKQQNAYWLILVLLWNAVHSAAFVGSERLRLQIDAYLIVLAAFFVDRLIVHLGRRKVLVPLNRV
jgi:4-amino-4-deoxy-L-arabinose transferase-like glycosyltransferase